MLFLSLPRGVVLSGGLALAAACGPTNETSGGARDTSRTSAADDRAAVEATVQGHWTAINNTDTLAIFSHHTPELTLIATETERRFAIPSPEADSVIALFWRGSKPAFNIRGLQVQLFGDAAVASFYLEGGTTLPNGRVDRRLRRVTEVWVRQPDGTWKEAHHHDSVFTPR